MTSLSGTGTFYLRQLSPSGYVEYSSNNTTWSNVNNWPLTFTNTAPSSGVLTIQFTTNIVFVIVEQQFIINSDNIIIDGQYQGENYTITIDNVANFPGLIQNGTSSSTSTYTDITIQNIGILVANATTLIANGGWLCQSYFCKGISTGSISILSCYSTGTIVSNAGGIIGAYAWYQTSGGTITVQDCYSTGIVRSDAGGIIGRYVRFQATGGTITVQDCYSTGIIDTRAGGIMGGAAGYRESGGTITVQNCYSTGTIGNNAGGIMAQYTGYQTTGGTINVQYCYSTGNVGNNAGGIMAQYAGYQTTGGTINVQYCYSTGTIGASAGGIIGQYAGYQTTVGTINVQYCYSTGTIGASAGGIMGGNVRAFATGGTIVVQNCYSTGTISSNAGGIMGANAGQFATGTTIIAQNCFVLSNTIYGASKNASVTTTTNCITSNIWSKTDADSTIATDASNVWLNYNDSNPWLLTVFDAAIYNPNSSTVNPGVVGNSEAGIFEPSYNYIMYDNLSSITDYVSISDATTGVLTISSTAPAGTYVINVLAGKLNGSVYSAYNHNTYTFYIGYPGAPYNLIAVAGDGQAIIGFDVNDGGSSLINLQYSLDDEAFVSFDPPQTISPVTISGLTNDQTYSVMLKAVNVIGPSAPSDPVAVTPIMCFNQGTDILCWNRLTDKEEYRPVEELKVGDMVKSYMHGYLPISHCKSSRMKNNPKKWYQCMYEMKKTEETEEMLGLFKDLIVTGGHGILVDKDHVPSKLQGVNNRKLRSTNTPNMVEDKYLLLSHLSPLFEKLDNRDIYTYYQFSLTDSSVDLDKRYGVWANGLLVETPSYNQILSVDKRHIMKQVKIPLK